MYENLMILPAKEFSRIRLVGIPEDLERQEAYRYVTGLIAKVEESQDYTLEDIMDLLEERGFESVDYVMGPPLD